MIIVNCPECKNKLEEQGIFVFCNKCNKKFTPVECYSRVVGYLRPRSTMNDSKQAEFDDRKKFDEIGDLYGKF